MTVASSRGARRAFHPVGDPRRVGRRAAPHVPRPAL